MIPDDLLHVAVRLAGDDQGKLDRIFDAEPAPSHDLPSAAAAYAAAGLPVFPLVPGQKRPIVPRGLHEATTDAAQVAAWWTRWPEANIGLRTGVIFDVIDVDGPPGYLSLLELRDKGLVPDTIGRVHTARGGAHLLIRPTGDGNTAGLLPGIDVRGANGYVVAPPSVSAETGRRWVWVTEPDWSTLAPGVAA